jgi:membrane associated rhomboid family serine protease
MATCYRHPSRETGVACSSCGRPICPDCMTTTPVGMRCPECAKQRTRVTRLRDVSDVPRVTYALIAINVLIYLSQQVKLSGGETLYDKGALLGSALKLESGALQQVGVAYGEWWRLVSGAFLHANVLHIGLNMLILYWLGRMLEPAIGPVRFAAVYAVSLFAGSLGAIVLTPHSYTVGASGAIFGVAGCLVVEMRARGISIAESGLGALIVINLLYGAVASGISLGGHVGGLIGGAIAGLLLQAAERRRLPDSAVLAGCVLLCAAFAVGAVLAAHASEPALPSSTQLVVPGG